MTAGTAALMSVLVSVLVSVGTHDASSVSLVDRSRYLNDISGLFVEASLRVESVDVRLVQAVRHGQPWRPRTPWPIPSNWPWPAALRHLYARGHEDSYRRRLQCASVRRKPRGSRAPRLRRLPRYGLAAAGRHRGQPLRDRLCAPAARGRGRRLGTALAHPGRRGQHAGTPHWPPHMSCTPPERPPGRSASAPGAGC